MSIIDAEGEIGRPLPRGKICEAIQDAVASQVAVARAEVI